MTSSMQVKAGMGSSGSCGGGGDSDDDDTEVR